MPDLRPHSDDLTAPGRGAAVGIGNFDGVHLGHRAVLTRLFEAAARLGVASVVYTFDPAPTAVVAPERHQPRLQTLASRVACLRAEGVAEVVVESFTREFASVPAPEFAREFLDRRLGVRALVVGHDFRFGNMRGGDAARLREWLPGVEIHEVAALADEHGPISSSRIRKLVAAGNVAAAALLLGRPHRVSGPVVLGDQRGRTIGFPTANIAMQQELLPGAGVYAGRAWVDGVAYLSAINLGIRPTVDGARYSVEAHLLDFSANLYGRELAIDLVTRIRDERRFGGLDALKTQIAKDVQMVRSVLT